MYNIILCGTPKFVVKFFEEFRLNHNFNILGVVVKFTKIEKKNKLIKCDIANWAKKNGLPLFEVQNINKNQEIKDILAKCDFALVFAFGQIISKELLLMPKLGWLNIHPSNLPLFRGPSPIQYAILNGLNETAITLMRMNEKMDEGDIISQKKFILNPYHNSNVVFYELSNWAPKWVIEEVLKFLKNEKSYSQSGYATYSYLIKKEDYEKKNTDSVDIILNKIRAFGYVNLEYFNIKFKCFVAKKYEDKDFLNIDGIAPIFIQLQGKKIIHIKAFINGYIKKIK